LAARHPTTIADCEMGSATGQRKVTKKEKKKKQKKGGGK